jgi:hypothetical protein
MVLIAKSGLDESSVSLPNLIFAVGPIERATNVPILEVLSKLRPSRDVHHHDRITFRSSLHSTSKRSLAPFGLHEPLDMKHSVSDGQTPMANPQHLFNASGAKPILVVVVDN